MGFSKSGIGGEDLILKHPDLFTLVASWDFPADMTTYDQYNASASYGTQSNFATNYELTKAFVDAHRSPFLSENRIWIGGYNAFQIDISDYDALLTSEGIAHTTGPSQLVAHRWDSGWVPAALAALYQDSLDPALGNAPPTAPEFDHDNPPTAITAGSTYSYTFSAEGEPAPTFAIEAGTLPAGMTLNPTTGILSGTPTVAGQFSFTVRATNGATPDALTSPITITVIPAGLDHLVLSPAAISITAGAPQRYTTDGFDAFGNSLDDVTAASTLTITPNVASTGASCNNTARTCTAIQAGTYTVTGTSGGKTGRATLTVVPRFTLRPGLATSISVGRNGSAWILGSNSVGGGYGIYRWNGTGWTLVPGGAMSIAVDPAGNPWIVNSAHQIFHWNGNGWSSYQRRGDRHLGRRQRVDVDSRGRHDRRR